VESKKGVSIKQRGKVKKTSQALGEKKLGLLEKRGDHFVGTRNTPIRLLSQRWPREKMRRGKRGISWGMKGWQRVKRLS